MACRLLRTNHNYNIRHSCRRQTWVLSAGRLLLLWTFYALLFSFFAQIYKFLFNFVAQLTNKIYQTHVINYSICQNQIVNSTSLQDFKAFAMKGNVVDMAVGVIISGAFGKIYSLWSRALPSWQPRRRKNPSLQLPQHLLHHLPRRNCWQKSATCWRTSNRRLTAKK